MPMRISTSYSSACWTSKKPPPVRGVPLPFDFFHVTRTIMIISSTHDYREAARRRLPRFLFDYIDGG
ncbi:hypothetical protein, partial [Lactococcus lactis]|uniref:hypothetical protein n=1 Tax=Lactococcus lactis TaxID=1358 RepID=UPI003D0D09B8